jgi:nucleotide-binding universal stress UspA family protein
MLKNLSALANAGRAGSTAGPDGCMKRVLIAYDGSALAEAALDDLAHAGLPPELELLAVTVADVWLPPDQQEAIYPEVPSAVVKARAQARQAVEAACSLAERAAARLKTLYPHAKIQAFATADSPAWGIVKKASVWKADLVALGSHGRSALERLFLGSVAQKVAAESPCSVRIARPRRASGRSHLRIVVAVDGSSDSQAAVAAVAERAWSGSTEFHVITVIDPKLQTAMAWPALYADQWLQQNDANADEWVCRMIEHSAQKLREAGHAVETHVFNGDAKQMVLQHAERWEADGIFLGARGLHHGDRLFLGSFASAVAARAHCSVEIVRPAAASRAART